MSRFRVLRRSGPGDRFQVIERDVPGDDSLPTHEQFKEVLDVALAGRADTTNRPYEAQEGGYLVQATDTLDARHFVVKIAPTIMEV